MTSRTNDEDTNRFMFQVTPQIIAPDLRATILTAGSHCELLVL